MKLLRVLPLVVALPLAACSSSTEDAVVNDEAITSNDGKILELTFRGSVVAGKDERNETAVLSQLQYMQGILTSAESANGQVGLAKLTNVNATTEGETKRITYDASVPVAWPKDRAVPTEYAVPLPLDATKLAAFNEKYDGKCGNNAYGREAFWHDFNPKAQGCELADADVHRANGAVREHPNATQGKYPEYDRVWSDDTLDVMGVFGIVTSDTPTDGGVVEMTALVAEAQRGMRDARVEDIAQSATVLRGKRVTGKITVDGRERTVNLTAVLLHSVADAGQDFDDIYRPASVKADFIYYGGHAGLGSNVASLASRANVERGKYQLIYLNGCQTFAYLGTAWHDKKREANGAQADPEGTKDLDMVANALPSYDDGGRSMLAVYKALVGVDKPQSYNDILKEFSARHLVAAFGEEDNVFRP
jgi:hypothetical protein